MQINLDQLRLDTFDKKNDKHMWLVQQFKGSSKSDFISMIDSRLELNGKSKTFPFDTAFVVSFPSDELIGYLFISGIRGDEVYLEYSLLEEKRGHGYGSLLLGLITEYLFANYNIKDIALDIDVSNEASMKTAIGCGYYEEDFINDKRMIYKNYNLGYVNKRKNGR